MFPVWREASEHSLFIITEFGFRLFGGDKYHAEERAKVEKRLLRHMKNTVPAKYHAMLTPDYGVGCKRRIFDASWFPGLNDSRIELTTQPLKAVKPKSVVIGPGQTYPRDAPNVATDEREIPADVIILANGFETRRFAHPLKILGRGGVDLIEEMDRRGGPQAYNGVAMDGFPNCFIIFGPNTATILNGDATTIEVKREAEEAYTADIQKSLSKMVWMKGGCASWYFMENNQGKLWNPTVYPKSEASIVQIAEDHRRSDRHRACIPSEAVRPRFGILRWLVQTGTEFSAAIADAGSSEDLASCIISIVWRLGGILLMLRSIDVSRLTTSSPPSFPHARNDSALNHQSISDLLKDG
ncbi:hypothetical protein MRB53_039550 [Persea americana]|nr:hypothetical protein MRB53_039550 [Persea americana]